MRDGYVVDHRSEIARLEPFLESRGGVVHVRSSPRSPASVFARNIRTVMGRPQWPISWISVQIEPSNPNTHYVTDIVMQVADTCGISLTQGAPPTRPGIEIATDIHASGDVEVSNVNVTIVDDPYERAMGERERIGRLAAGLEELLQARRVALLFLGTHGNSADTIRSVIRDLWDGVLEPLTAMGLLLIDISDPTSMPNDCSWPPDPDIAFDLPELLDDLARATAIEDLAAIAQELGKVNSPDEALVFGKTLVASSSDIRDLYARLGRVLLALD
jgi:hypothetical protein